MGGEVSKISNFDFTECCSTPRHRTGSRNFDLDDDPASAEKKMFRLTESGQHMMLEHFLVRKYGKIDVNAFDAKGQSALHVAARHGFLGCIKTLVAVSRSHRTLLPFQWDWCSTDSSLGAQSV